MLEKYLRINVIPYLHGKTILAKDNRQLVFLFFRKILFSEECACDCNFAKINHLHKP